MKHLAKKRFGQNFLTDPAIISSLIDAISPQHDDLMVEIGPGLGALTKPLMQKLKFLHVVELDRDICAWMVNDYAKQYAEKSIIIRLIWDGSFVLASPPYPLSFREGESISFREGENISFREGLNSIILIKKR